MLSGLLHGDTFFLDNFAVRQWDEPGYSGTRVSYDKTDFVKKAGTHFTCNPSCMHACLSCLCSSTQLLRACTDS